MGNPLILDIGRLIAGNPARLIGIVKISDGSNTVGLTVPSSLGSDKTMTIPNVTGTLGTVLISAGSFSSSSFTQGDFTSASYDRYIIKLSTLVPSTDGTTYRFKLMSGASTYMTGTYNEGHYYTKANASGSGTSAQAPVMVVIDTENPSKLHKTLVP